MESAKLREAFPESRLRQRPPPHRPHRRLRHSSLSTPRLPTRLLHVLPRRPSQRSSLPTGHRPALGQLSRPRLFLENHSWLRRRPQRIPAISPHHPRASQFVSLLALRSCPHAHSHLHAVRLSSSLRFYRTHPPQSHRSVPRSRCHAALHLLPHHSSSISPRPDRRSYLRLRSLSRRFSRAASRRRPVEHHDRQHRAKSLRHRLRLAARRRHLRLHFAPYRHPALPHRAPRKKVGLPMSTSRSTTRRAPLLATYAILVFAFLYLPIAVLILYSFNRDGVGGFPPHHLTLAWYRQLFADGPIWDSVLNSLLVALGAAALALDRASFPGKSFFRRLVLLPLILPGIITGLSLLMFAVTLNFARSLILVFFGHGTALISVATTELFAGLQKLDRAQEEASLDLGATPWQTFWRVTLPNLRLSLVAAALLVFTLSMDEIAVTFFLIGSNNTLPLEIFARLRRGITPEINAISTLIFAISVILILIWYRIRTHSIGPQAQELLE